MANFSAALATTQLTGSKLVTPQKFAKESKANQAAQDFEAVMISEMLKPMFATIDVDDTFGGGRGEEVFRGLLVQEMGKSIAKQGGLGLADTVRTELLKTQELANTTKA